jgi:hypothetical protein
MSFSQKSAFFRPVAQDRLQQVRGVEFEATDVIDSHHHGFYRRFMDITCDLHERSRIDCNKFVESNLKLQTSSTTITMGLSLDSWISLAIFTSAREDHGLIFSHPPFELINCGDRVVDKSFLILDTISC